MFIGELNWSLLLAVANTNCVTILHPIHPHKYKTTVPRNQLNAPPTSLFIPKSARLIITGRQLFPFSPSPAFILENQQTSSFELEFEVNGISEGRTKNHFAWSKKISNRPLVVLRFGLYSQFSYCGGRQLYDHSLILPATDHRIQCYLITRPIECARNSQ